MANFCSNCGTKLIKEAKYCSKCGVSVSGEAGKLKRGRSKGWLFLSLSVLMGFAAVILFSLPNKQGEVLGGMFAIFSGGFYLSSLVILFRFIWRKNRYAGMGILLIIIMFVGSLIVINQAEKAYIYQIAEIENLAADVAYAKSIGDDIMAGRKVTNGVFFFREKSQIGVYAFSKITSMAQVHDRVNYEYEKIKAKRVKEEISDFRTSVLEWTEEIVNVSNLADGDKPTQAEKARWKKLPSAPAVVYINLTSEKKVAAFEAQVSEIKKLKNAGDSAIAKKDAEAMRAVYAKAQVASNFIDSISFKTANVCSRRGCAPEVKKFTAGVVQSSHNYMAGVSGAGRDWKNTWSEAPEIIKAKESPLGGLGIHQGSVEPTPPPNPSTTIRKRNAI